MTQKRRFLVLFMSLLATGVQASSQEEARRLQAQGKIKPLEYIIQQAHQHTGGRIIEVEMEDHHGRLEYEVEMLNEGGEVWEFRFDAETGELLQMERED